MQVIAIILAAVLLIALIRVGVIVQYNDTGIAVWLKICFLKIKLNLGDNKRKRKQKAARKLNLGNMKPGSLREFTDMLRTVKKMLGRLKRKLLVKKLIVHYTSAGTDPAVTAMQFGAANAVFGIIIPILDRHFRIKHRELSTSADFNSNEPGIYMLLNVSIALWESVYVIIAVLPMFSSIDAAAAHKPEKAEGKDRVKNGKRTDKQPA